MTSLLGAKLTAGSDNIVGRIKTLDISLKTKFSAQFSIVFSFNNLGTGMALFYTLT
jgi:hypothetical protein